MRNWLLVVAAACAPLAACAPPAYYVSNIYADESGTLYTQRCPIDAGRNGDKPDPANCRYERVGPPPAELRAQLPPAGPPGPPAPPPPPGPPAPPSP